MLTFGAFAKGLLRVASVLAEEQTSALDDIGADVAKRARGKIGELQPAVGPFPAPRRDPVLPHEAQHLGLVRRQEAKPHAVVFGNFAHERSFLRLWPSPLPGSQEFPDSDLGRQNQ